MKGKKTRIIGDTPEQIKRCMNCLLPQCIDCLASHHTKHRNLRQMAANMPDEDIINAIYDTMESLNLECMPMKKEIDEVMQDRSYTYAILYRGGLKHWADRLGITWRWNRKYEGQINTAD